MYAPGRLLHLVERQQQSQQTAVAPDCDGGGRCFMDMRWLGAEELDQVVLRTGLMLDHLPDRVRWALGRARQSPRGKLHARRQLLGALLSPPLRALAFASSSTKATDVATGNLLAAANGHQSQSKQQQHQRGLQERLHRLLLACADSAELPLADLLY
jgi:hypothetical protein